MRMNPPTFYGTKVDEDPQGFIDELFKMVDVMGVTPREKAELATYMLKDVAQVWFEKWRDEIPLRKDPVDWEVFKTALIDWFFHIQLIERKLVEFMYLSQGGMTVKEYYRNFTKLSKYSTTLVANSRARTNNFMMQISKTVEKEC